MSLPSRIACVLVVFKPELNTDKVKHLQDNLLCLIPEMNESHEDYLNQLNSVRQVPDYLRKNSRLVPNVKVTVGDDEFIKHLFAPHEETMHSLKEHPPKLERENFNGSDEEFARLLELRIKKLLSYKR